MPKVLPCPFCGSENTAFDPELDLVFCNDCHAESGLDGLRGWNQRSVLGAIAPVIAHLRENDVPAGVGKIFAARLSRAEEVPEDAPDELFKRDLMEALVTLMKCLRAEAAKKPEEDRAAQ
ncbi:MAG: hypothetical protein AAGH68_14710 [Pseudomonadota bacterium]